VSGVLELVGVVCFYVGFIGAVIWADVRDERITAEWARHFDARITHSAVPARAEINAGEDV
jgi:hypothetical protein